MCKLLIMTGITEGLVAEEFMRRMATPMSKNNSHGIGYSAVASDGNLFSERWLNNDQFFSTAEIMTPEIARALEPYAKRLPKNALDINYNSLGEVNFRDIKTVTMHTRFATCGREFANTHPFIYEDTSLIHNGMISNAFSTGHYYKGLDVNKISTCDSEAALQTYLSTKVNLDSSKAKEWLDLLKGSWAFGILSRNTEGKRILDVVKGSSRLSYMEIEGLGKVFTTDDEDAKSVVTSMGLTFTKSPIIVDLNEFYRFDAITGELLQSVDIKPKYNTNYYGKNRGRTTTTTYGTSSFQSNKSSSEKPGQSLIDMLDAFRDDPQAMQLMPDIFTDGSNTKNLSIDYRKVKKYGNDTTIPLVERLETFDMVFCSNFVEKYKSLPPQLKEYIRESDAHGQGLKSIRGLINSLYEKKSSVG